MKRILTLLMIFVMILELCACSNAKEKMLLESEEVDLAQVHQEYRENAVRAKKLYEGKVVKCTVEVERITAYGLVETLIPKDKNGNMYLPVDVYFKDDNDVVTLNKNDEITVVGKLHIVGDLYIYSTSIRDAYLVSVEQ